MNSSSKFRAWRSLISQLRNEIVLHNANNELKVAIDLTWYCSEVRASPADARVAEAQAARLIHNFLSRGATGVAIRAGGCHNLSSDVTHPQPMTKQEIEKKLSQFEREHYDVLRLSVIFCNRDVYARRSYTDNERRELLARPLVLKSSKLFFGNSPKHLCSAVVINDVFVREQVDLFVFSERQIAASHQ